MDKDSLRSAADVVQSLFQNSKSQLSDGFLRYKLELGWREVVGETLVANTRPTQFRDGVLTIAVSNSGWVHHLQFFREEIISKVNAYVGKTWVTEVKYVVR